MKIVFLKGCFSKLVCLLVLCGFYLTSGNVYSSDPQKQTKQPNQNSQQIVNVFSWHDQIPLELIKAFEAETGIKVRLDTIDSNEVLEAKLLAGSTGYDVVYPTALPFGARQSASGLYAPINKKALNHYAEINPDFLKRLSNADPGNMNLIPYTWGLVAIGYNPDLLPEGIQESDLNSWGLVYDPDLLALYADRGVTLLDDPVDVFTTFYLYQGANPVDTSRSLLKDMTNKLKERRSFYRRFSSNLVAEQLGNKELAVAMHWSGILSTAREKFKKLGEKTPLKIILPKEGTMMWVDCLAIPHDAPHIENAHAFIDFLLRPENAAVVSNKTYTATTISNAKAHIREEIRSNETVFPGDEYMKKVSLPEIKSLQFQRLMSRAFASLMTHKKER